MKNFIQTKFENFLNEGIFIMFKSKTTEEKLNKVDDIIDELIDTTYLAAYSDLVWYIGSLYKSTKIIYDLLNKNNEDFNSNKDRIESQYNKLSNIYSSLIKKIRSSGESVRGSEYYELLDIKKGLDRIQGQL